MRAKFWLAVLTEIKNRGTADVCMVVCDGLKGLPEAVNTVWDRAIIQTCVIHLLRNTFRYASRKYWDQIAKDIRPVYTAPTETAAKERFVEFTAKVPQVSLTERADSGQSRFVVVDADGFLHPEATAWLQSLTDVGRSAEHRLRLRPPSRVVSVVVRVDDGLAQGHAESPGVVAPHCRCLTCVENQRPQRFS